jgi:small subunit ribosomal protein S2
VAAAEATSYTSEPVVESTAGTLASDEALAELRRKLTGGDDEAPAAAAPAADEPAAETPVAEAPVAEAPAVEAETAAPQTDETDQTDQTDTPAE